MIAFTSDIDWAPEEIIDDTISLFEEYGVKCTFFSTHNSKVLAAGSKELFEIAIHPDFNPILNGTSNLRAIDVINAILDIHPDAKGVRSHSMLQSTNILQLFAEKKLIYEANQFLPYHTGIKPFRLWNGLVRIPYNWEDDIHWTYGFDFKDSRIDLRDSGLNIFNFHPVHIFLNTENEKRYLSAKEFYKDPVNLKMQRNNEKTGARDLLIMLLEYVKKNSIETKTLLEIANEFAAQ